jgi:hypothetical protein
MNELTPSAGLIHGEASLVYADAVYQRIENSTEMEGSPGLIQSLAQAGLPGLPA